MTYYGNDSQGRDVTGVSVYVDLKCIAIKQFIIYQGLEKWMFLTICITIACDFVLPGHAKLDIGPVIFLDVLGTLWYVC